MELMTASTTRLLVAAALALFLGCLGLAVALGLDDTETAAVPAAATTPPAQTTATKTRAAKPAPFVELTAVGAYDPEGDERENDEEAPLAVDGRRDTAWHTERYTAFFKSGVGLVLDIGRRSRVEQVLVETKAPGARAAILLGDTPQGPFRPAAAPKSLRGKTAFPVAKRPGRYVLVWVVEIPAESAAEIAEVRVRARP
jgi:hypothetical protein